MQKYVLYQGKKLRYGFTTGSSAAAATKAACILLAGGKLNSHVTVNTPAAEQLSIKIHAFSLDNDCAIVSVIKDGGDDADVTSGLEIGAKVFMQKEPILTIKGGIGVGIVQKKGLSINIGEPAINPVPKKMITQSVLEVFDLDNKGVVVEIFVPHGEEIAKKTLNYKLGIEGGISILGTTGIVRPMSEEAFKDSLAIELKAMIKQQESDTFVFTFGNYGQSFAKKKLHIDKNNIIVISNFVGFMLEQACEFGIKKILFVGNIGKIVKVAGGIFHTHSRVSDARLEIMASNAIEAGESLDIAKKIIGANTTEEAVEYIQSNKTFQIMANKVKQKCEEHVKRSGYELEVETLIYSNTHGELSRTKNFIVESQENE